MALRRKVWHFSPGETRAVGVSFDSELGASEILDGNNIDISAWTKTGEDAYTEVDTFTFTNAQVNASQQTTDDGEVIAAGRGLFWRCTAPVTLGTYYIRSEGDTDDSNHLVRGGKPYDVLIVSGPGTPA